MEAAGAGAVVADAGGGSPAAGGGDSGGASEPAQVIPSNLGGGDDTGDPGDIDAATGKPRPPKPSKHKIKRGGQEVEMALDEILKLASDDYEHEIQVSGQPRKAKWPDLVRGYQLHEGAFDRMRKAAETEKSWAEKLDHGKKDPEWFMQMELGIEDPTRFFAEKLRTQMALEEELNELFTKDRFEFNRRQEQLAQERTKRMSEFQARKQAAEQAQAKRAEGLKRRDAILQDVLTKNGMPWNDGIKNLAVSIFEKYRSVGHTLSPQDVATMTRQEYEKQVREFLGQHDEDSLLKFLGDERRKKLREYELAQVKRGQKQQGQQQQQQAAARPNNGGGNGKGKQTGMTEAEFREFMRR